MMTAAIESAPTMSTMAVCRALALPRSSFYRHRRPPVLRKPPCLRLNSLPAAERDNVLSVLNSERFADQAPAEIYATLLDEGKYLCSVRTMYRLLHANKSVAERRNITRHTNYQKPELIADSPNQVWSWDITKLKGPAKWTYFYLYVILDIFSRRVVGWCVADREVSMIFHDLIEEAICQHEVSKDQLTLHADRGAPMTSKTTAQLLSDLGVTKTHSRPYNSNDNPFSESAFKTLKYQPKFPKEFGCIEDAKIFCRSYFDWYNNRHHHSGLGFMTPNQVHYNQVDAVFAARQETLDSAWNKNPQRFRRRPTPPQKPRRLCS
jgi:putative transposase